MKSRRVRKLLSPPPKQPIVLTGNDSGSNQDLGQDQDMPADTESTHRRLSITWDHCDDLHVRWLSCQGGRVLLVWIHSLVGKDIAQIGVLEPIASRLQQISTLQDIQQQIWTTGLKELNSWTQVDAALSHGDMLIFMDGSNQALAADVNGFQARPVDKPELEPGVIGPQSAFVESIDKNIGLIRTILRTPRLKMVYQTVGMVSDTRVAVSYVEGITKPELVAEVQQRISRINIDGILDLNMIREMINDAPLSPFPCDQVTERPDRVAAALLQGRFAVLCDGSPEASMGPATFMNHLQSNEDYYAHFVPVAFIRILRHLMYWISLLLPALNVAILSYHQEMVPTRLLITFSATREGVPFPVAIEAFVMMIAFEALREAGIRLPKAVGQSVSIVGALVIGQAAVQAGLVSPGMVIVIAIAGVASFTIPSYHLAYVNRFLQFGFALLAGLFGLVGITAGLFILLAHLVSLRSYGIPYMSPLAPLEWKSLGRDVFIRAPWWNMTERPDMMEPVDAVRENMSKPGLAGTP